MSGFEPEQAPQHELERARTLVNLITKYPQLWNGADAWQAWNASDVEGAGITLPQSSISGGSLFVPQFANVTTAESLTGTTSYSDLATVGPQVSGLPAGTYVALWTALVDPTSPGLTDSVAMSLAVNGSDIGDSIAAVSPGAQAGPIVSFYAGNLTAGTNTVKARYRLSTAADEVSFSRRSLILFRTAS